MALQGALIAGCEDASTVAARCMEGRGSDAERQAALDALYESNDLPETVRALVEPHYQPAAPETGAAVGNETSPCESAVPVDEPTATWSRFDSSRSIQQRTRTLFLFRRAAAVRSTAQPRARLQP